MAQQIIDTTSGAGDTGKAGGDKVNANFAELYGVSDAGFIEALQDMVGAFAAGVSGGGLVVTYNDAGNALTFGRGPVDGLTTAATAVASADSFEIAQGSAVKRATAAMLRDYVQSQYGLVKNNVTATSDPGTGNDTTQGYASGSTWFNTSTGLVWVCHSAASGAAIWALLSYADSAPYISGNWYATMPGTITSGTATGSTAARFHPFVPKRDISINGLGGRVVTVGSSNAQFAVYNAGLVSGQWRPTTLLQSTASQPNTAAQNISGSITSTPLTAGQLYFLGVAQNDATGAFTCIGSSSAYVAALLGSTTAANTTSNTLMTHLSTPVTFGAWGNLSAATFTENATGAYALIQVKIA